tara:strand:- start:106 stop:300 length:195 start_codon:yes stop_codon:yes gene_type:complete
MYVRVLHREQLSELRQEYTHAQKSMRGIQDRAALGEEQLAVLKTTLVDVEGQLSREREFNQADR